MPISQFFGPKSLRKFNNLLTLIVVVLGSYIVLLPLIPAASYAVQSTDTQNINVVQVTPASIPSSEPIPQENMLSLPRINMKEIVHTGASVSELNKGAWLVPDTSTPDKESNTVIVGHRTTFTGPGVFYGLDRVQINDRITVSWQKKEYTYKVANIKVVPASTISVHAPSKGPQLTLYTCTPLWSLKDRLVITAPLVGVRS